MAENDNYEAKYMNAGAALVRSRKPMPWFWFAFMGVAVLVSAGGGIAAGNPLPLLLSVPLLVAVTLLFGVLRVVVTRNELHVQLGLWGPKVAIDRIDHIEAQAYSALVYGGWGIRIGADGSWAYSVPGGTGRGVRVEYRDASGKKKALFVSTDDADEIVRTVLDLQGRATGTGVRVDGAEAEPAAEQDAEPKAEELAAKSQEKR